MNQLPRPARRPRTAAAFAALALCGTLAVTGCEDAGTSAKDAGTSHSTGKNVSETTTASPEPKETPTSTETPGTADNSLSDAAAVSEDPAISPSESTTAPSAASGEGTAVAALAALPVKGRAPMTGFSRDQFGPAWLDADRNGCDTRSDVLNAFLTNIVHKANTHDCTVLSGTLTDPYTGNTIDYVRGDNTSIDIDHVAALGDVWAMGGWKWDIHTRAAISNDPLNLLPVDYSANRQKGDSDAASWLPPNKSYWCDYVARQVAVKTKYGLAVTSAEKTAIEKVLSACPTQPLTADVAKLPTSVDQNIKAPAQFTSSSSSASTSDNSQGGTKSTAPHSDSNVYYENCTAVGAAGAAPIHRGDPGYDSHLDRDGDGVACE